MSTFILFLESLALDSFPPALSIGIEFPGFVLLSLESIIFRGQGVSVEGKS